MMSEYTIQSENIKIWDILAKYFCSANLVLQAPLHYVHFTVGWVDTIKYFILEYFCLLIKKKQSHEYRDCAFLSKKKLRL
jgi:hypothetical protein